MHKNKGNEFDEINDGSFNFNVNENNLVKVCFYSIEEKLLFEKHFSLNTCLGEVINEFLDKQDNNEKYSFSFYIKGNSSQFNIIDEQKLISYYLTILQDTIFLMEQGLANNSGITTSMCSNKFLKIYVKKSQFMKDIPENIEEYIIKNTQLIGKPAINKLGYYVFNKEKKDSKIKFINILEKQKEKIKLDFFSRKTVYCNAENNLYIYEGIKPLLISSNNISLNYSIDFNNYIGKFICINLKNNEIYLLSTKFPPRVLHSMIFIPKNYIFIIGGKNSKEVLIYIIKKQNNSYEKYPHLLPFDLYEPSLILINNKYLYAFENSTFSLHILRTNFICQSPFEEIQLKNDYIPINQKFFGVVKSKNSILFLGGQMINDNSNNNNNYNKNSFEFNYISEVLLLGKRLFMPFDLCEKTFIPLGGEEYIQISEIYQNYEYIPSLIIFQNHLKKSNKSNTTNTLSNGTKCFESIKTKQINIKLPDNMTSIVVSSSNQEMGIPLYNNYKNKK